MFLFPFSKQWAAVSAAWERSHPALPRQLPSCSPHGSRIRVFTPRPRPRVPAASPRPTPRIPASPCGPRSPHAVAVGAAAAPGRPPRRLLPPRRGQTRPQLPVRAPSPERPAAQRWFLGIGRPRSHPPSGSVPAESAEQGPDDRNPAGPPPPKGQPCALCITPGTGSPGTGKLSAQLGSISSRQWSVAALHAVTQLLHWLNSERCNFPGTLQGNTLCATLQYNAAEPLTSSGNPWLCASLHQTSNLLHRLLTLFQMLFVHQLPYIDEVL